MNAPDLCAQATPYSARLEPLPRPVAATLRVPTVPHPAELPASLSPASQPWPDGDQQSLRLWLTQQIRRSRAAFPRRTCRACGRRSHYGEMLFEHGWFCDAICAQEHWSDPGL